MNVNDAISHNTAVFEKGGPRLSYDYQPFVVERDTERGLILLGGLGAAGVGQMWVDEQPHHATYPGYPTA